MLGEQSGGFLYQNQMKLDRDIEVDASSPKRGKYALIKLRVTDAITPTRSVDPRIITTTSVVKNEAIDFGDSADSDFFVIRLKDKFAAPALAAYAMAAWSDDREYAQSVLKLALDAACHQHKQMPD